mmetsp:Transcript_30313/g.77046  ORF Transcript_30313/g.77046 Transcript_30313/m.77046 type:complete len:290 (+) Transcript_30313:389-1258(+)
MTQSPSASLGFGCITAEKPPRSRRRTAALSRVDLRDYSGSVKPPRSRRETTRAADAVENAGGAGRKKPWRTWAAPATSHGDRATWCRDARSTTRRTSWLSACPPGNKAPEEGFKSTSGRTSRCAPASRQPAPAPFACSSLGRRQGPLAAKASYCSPPHTCTAPLLFMRSPSGRSLVSSSPFRTSRSEMETLAWPKTSPGRPRVALSTRDSSPSFDKRPSGERCRSSSVSARVRLQKMPVSVRRSVMTGCRALSQRKMADSSTAIVCLLCCFCWEASVCASGFGATDRLL